MGPTTNGQNDVQWSCYNPTLEFKAAGACAAGSAGGAGGAGGGHLGGLGSADRAGRHPNRLAAADEPTNVCFFGGVSSTFIDLSHTQGTCRDGTVSVEIPAARLRLWGTWLAYRGHSTGPNGVQQLTEDSAIAKFNEEKRRQAHNPLHVIGAAIILSPCTRASSAGPNKQNHVSMTRFSPRWHSNTASFK